MDQKYPMLPISQSEDFWTLAEIGFAFVLELIGWRALACFSLGGTLGCFMSRRNAFLHVSQYFDLSDYFSR